MSDRPFCMYLGVRQTMTPAVTTFKRYNACVRYTNGVKYGSHRGREGPLVNQGRIFDDPLGSQSILEGVDDSRRRRSGTVHVVERQDKGSKNQKSHLLEQPSWILKPTDSTGVLFAWNFTYIGVQGGLRTIRS